MKRLAVWLSVMVCFFGSCQLYAAPSKAGAVARAVGFAIGHKWAWWVVLLIAVVGIVGYLDDKKEEKEKKQLEKNHDEKGVT